MQVSSQRHKFANKLKTAWVNAYARLSMRRDRDKDERVQCDELGNRTLFSTNTVHPIALLPIVIIFAPLAAGFPALVTPLLHSAPWFALLDAPRLWPALWLSLGAAAGSTVLALLLCMLITAGLYPHRRWLQLQQRLPSFLALPHVAFAIGVAFLLAPSGWLARNVALLSSSLAELVSWAPLTFPNALVHDRYALTLTITLAIKECWFLLWAVAALLQRQSIEQQLTLARTLGYPTWQIWLQVLWPQLLPRLRWPLVAVAAYSLSVVDMALILGPSTPPTLAVLIWQWLSDADPLQRQMGLAASLLLPLLLYMLGLSAALLWRGLQSFWQAPTGRRAARQHDLSQIAPPNLTMTGRPRPHRGSRPASLLFGLLASLSWLALALIALWSVAGRWFYPALWPAELTLQSWQQLDWQPFFSTVLLAVSSVIVALPLTLIWLEWGARRLQPLLYLPLIFPALPLVTIQYHALLLANADGSISAVIWSHLLWVFPYMLLILSGPYRALDPRLLLTARTLGYRRYQACLRLLWPSLWRPIVLACAVGISVSVAQYLPTLFAGAGRIATVTTEAVTLSSGGNRQVLAVQALLQCLLPWLAFSIAALTSRLGQGRVLSSSYPVFSATGRHTS